MANLYCDLLFGYSHRKEYLGNLNFRNVTSMQAQHIYAASASHPPVADNVPELYTGAYTGVIVNGVNFGTGRIVSFSNPVSTEVTEDGRHLWKQIVNFEVYSSGDFANIAGTTTSSLIAGYTGVLQALDENFSFDLAQNGDYQYTRAGTVRCIDNPIDGTSGYVSAKNIAVLLMANKPPFGYIDSSVAGFYETAVGRKIYSEAIDIFGGSITFDEKFLIQSKDFLKHSVGFDNGFINVSESALMRHSGVSKAEDVFNAGTNPYQINTRYTTAINLAYSRCAGLFDTYANVLNIWGDSTYAGSLSTQPAQLTKSFDERSQEFSYNVVYTNNPNMTISGYTIDREQTLSQNNLGIIEASESASLVDYSFKSTASHAVLKAGVLGEILGAKARLTTLWSLTADYKQSSESKTFSSHGKRAAYSISYTNDPSLVYDGTFISKNYSFADNLPIRMHNPYFIIGRRAPLVHNPGQTQLGGATSAINAVLIRPAGYSAGTPVRPSAALNSMFLQALNTLLQKISIKNPSDVFVTKVNYTYNSNMLADLSIEAQYLYPKLTNT
jgi:hypothetical protein